MKKISVIKKEWLRDRVDELSRTGTSKADIARKLEVKPQYLNSLLNADRGITDQFLDKFIEAFCVNQIDLFAMIVSGREKPPEAIAPTVVYSRDPRDIELIETQKDLIAYLKREPGSKAFGSARTVTPASQSGKSRHD